jgi:uncharacterized CHY-type Zn-finger protein
MQYADEAARARLAASGVQARQQVSWHAFTPDYLEQRQSDFLYCGRCKGMHRKDGFSPEQQKEDVRCRYCQGWSNKVQRENGTNHYPWIDMVNPNMHTYGCDFMRDKLDVELCDIPGVPRK